VTEGIIQGGPARADLVAWQVMSWRAESTYKPSSALTDEEKEFLKLAKKLREILKLEDKSVKGEPLQENQLQKIADKDKLLKDAIALAGKFPPNSEVLGKNQDIQELMPASKKQSIERQRKKAEEQLQQEQERLRRRDERDREERNRAEHMPHHKRAILGIAAVEGTNYLYTCSKDKFLLCWSMEKTVMSSICTFAGHAGAVWAVDVRAPTPGAAPGSSPSWGWLLSGAADGKVMLWRADAGRRAPESVAKPESTIDHGGIVRVVRWCPFDVDSSTPRFASASEKLVDTPPAIAVWRVGTRGGAKQLVRMEDLPGKANDLRWAGGGKEKLLSAHDNGYVGVWLPDPPGSLRKTLQLHGGPVASLCLTPDQSTLLTASHDRSAAAVDITTPAMDVLRTYKTDRPLNAVAVSSDFKLGEVGTLVVAGGRDPMIVTKSVLLEDEFEAKVLDSSTEEQIAAGKGHFGPVHAVFSLPWLGPQGAFATASEDGCVRVHGVDGQLLHADTGQ